MKQYLYLKEDGTYHVSTVSVLDKANPNWTLIGPIDEIINQNKNLAQSNAALEFQLRRHLIS